MKSVVVCGSKRYKKEVAKFCKDLEELGVLVFEPSISQPFLGHEVSSSEYAKKIFKGLTLEHFDWVRKAEVCYVYNKDGYVGASVTMEMGFAVALGKPIFALSDDTGDTCRDGLIDKVVKSPKALAALL
jgi:hypothetical protein